MFTNIYIYILIIRKLECKYEQRIAYKTYLHKGSTFDISRLFYNMLTPNLTQEKT